MKRCDIRTELLSTRTVAASLATLVALPDRKSRWSTLSVLSKLSTTLRQVCLLVRMLCCWVAGFLGATRRWCGAGCGGEYPRNAIVERPDAVLPQVPDDPVGQKALGATSPKTTLLAVHAGDIIEVRCVNHLVHGNVTM
jgi:hypothetical protein